MDMTKPKLSPPAVRVARTGLLFALALVLSLLEGLVALPIPVPGIRLGLSNVVVMYCVFLAGPGQAYLLGALKAMFVLLTRGASGAFLSLCGGLCSITAMLLVLRLCKGKNAYTPVSVAGAVAHNAGQILGAVLLLPEATVLWYYFPVLTAVGILVGTLTAVLLRAILPALRKIREQV